MRPHHVAPLIKVLVFVISMGFLIACVGVVFARVKIQPSNQFHAVFRDASGIKPGADVRGNGVSIGSVKSVHLDHGEALVTFTVAKSLRLTDLVTARIRWANLTGDRYLDLEPGSRDRRATLTPGSTIPLSHTVPALDLDTFFQGFDPLMQGLDPSEINALAQNVLDITQGQVGAVQAMLSNVAKFTNGLADRDQLIGDTITNLSKALTLVDDHRDDFNRLIVGLARLTKGFAQDRKVIGSSLTSVDDAANQTADLLRRIRPGIKENVDNVGNLAAALNSNVTEIRSVLDLYPEFLGKLGRLGSNGGFFNFYLCGVKVNVNLPGTTLDVYTPWLIDNTGRCGGKAR